MFGWSKCVLLAWLHFSAEELLLYPPVSGSSCASTSTCKMLGQILKSENFRLSAFSFAFNFVYHTNKALYDKSSRQLCIWWLWHLWCSLWYFTVHRNDHEHSIKESYAALVMLPKMQLWLGDQMHVDVSFLSWLKREILRDGYIDPHSVLKRFIRIR